MLFEISDFSYKVKTVSKHLHNLNIRTGFLVENKDWYRHNLTIPLPKELAGKHPKCHNFNEFEGVN